MNDARISDTVMGDHLIAFIDLLGFEALIESSDSSAQTKIRSLLEKLAKLRGDFELRVESQVGVTSTYIAPAVSSFSDSIAVSFDIAELEKSDMGFFIAWKMLCAWFGDIATEAIKIGCPLRGGLTIGPLYHKGGVVFGRGLVEAYKLESMSARYPRIIVSSKILERTNAFPAYHEALYQSEDGEWCFDYLLAAYQTLSDTLIPLDLPARRKAKREWAESTLRSLMREIVRHPGGSRAHQNWRWLQNQLLSSLSKLNPHEFDPDGKPTMFEV